MNYYMVKDQAGQIKIVKSRSKPVGFIKEVEVDPITGAPDNPDWLVELPSGEVVVDKAAKKRIIAERKEKKDQNKASSEIAKNLRNYFENFEKQDLTDIAEIQEAIDNIIQYIKLTR